MGKKKKERCVFVCVRASGDALLGEGGGRLAQKRNDSTCPMLSNRNETKEEKKKKGVGAKEGKELTIKTKQTNN